VRAILNSCGRVALAASGCAAVLLAAACSERPIATSIGVAAPAAASTSSGVVPPSPELAQRMAALEAAVARLEARLEPAAAQVAANPVALTPAAPQVKARDENRAQPDVRAHSTMLDASFRSEATQSAWAQSATSAVQAALISVAPPGLSRSIDCRARTCRVTLADDPEKVQQWLPQAGLQLSAMFGSVRSAEHAGATVVYFGP
jgi:hypothetical protein